MTTHVIHTGRKKGTHSREGAKSQMARLIVRDGLNCHWCRRLCNPNLSSNADLFPTRDHVIRKADGGSTRLENLVVACFKCNTSRHGPGWKPEHSLLTRAQLNAVKLRLVEKIKPEKPSYDQVAHRLKKAEERLAKLEKDYSNLLERYFKVNLCLKLLEQSSS